MLIDLPALWIALLNILGIPIVHISIAWLCTQLPWKLFNQPCKSVHNEQLWMYEKLFRIRSWKNLLPDGAPWMGGFAKGSLESTDPSYLHRFIAETRRGEVAHWIQFLCILGFCSWTPSPAALTIVLYSTISNLPCILNLRYTRLRMARVLARH